MYVTRSGRGKVSRHQDDDDIVRGALTNVLLIARELNESYGEFFVVWKHLCELQQLQLRVSLFTGKETLIAKGHKAANCPIWLLILLY